MAEQDFEVIFAGELVPGFDEQTVRAKVAALFKADIARVAHLFSGEPVSIKRGLDEATARSYLSVLEQAGARAAIVAPGKPPTTAPQPSATVAAQSAPALAAARTKTPTAPAYDVAEPGAVLVETSPVPPADISTDHLSLAAPGADLVEPQAVSAPSYDLSHFTLDPPGVVLVEPKPAPAAEFDISGLHLHEEDKNDPSAK